MYFSKHIEISAISLFVDGLLGQHYQQPTQNPHPFGELPQIKITYRAAEWICNLPYAQGSYFPQPWY